MMTIFKEAWIQQLLDNPYIGIIITDKSRKQLYVNSHLCEATGYAQEELIGHSSIMLHVSKESYEKFEEKLLKPLLAGESVAVDYSFRHKNGRLFWANVSASVINDSAEVLWTVVDVTQRVNAQNEIGMLKESLELAMNGSRDIAWDLNLDNGNFFMPHKWKAVVGYDAEDTPYTVKEWRKHIYHEDLRKVLEVLRECENGVTDYVDVVYRLKHKEGHLIWLNLRATLKYSNFSSSMHLSGTQRDITEQVELEHKLESQQKVLEFQANHDALTQLPNRFLFNDRLEQTLKKCKRHKFKMALFFIDLDAFKEINDTMGHKAGDEVLKIVAQRIKESVREEDTVARLGGDEFTVILEDIKYKKDIIVLAKKVVKALAEEMILEDESLKISCSLGIGMYPQDSTDADTLLSNADNAMYDAKAKGKNNFQFYSIK